MRLLPVDKNAGYTLYALLGDWAVGLCAILVLMTGVPGMQRFRNK